MTELPPVLFFDLDDTIVSFSVGKPDFFRDAFALHGAGLGCTGDEFAEAIAAVVGPYWSDPVRAARGRRALARARREVVALAAERLGLQPETSREACDRIADRFTVLKEEAVHPLPRAIETLALLRQRGVRLGLISNGSSELQRRKLWRYELEGFFESILIEGEWSQGKPETSIFTESLRRMSVTADEAWMVGDNLVADIHGASRVGLKTVWIDHEGRGVPSDAPAKPDRVIASIRELL